MTCLPYVPPRSRPFAALVSVCTPLRTVTGRASRTRPHRPRLRALSSHRHSTRRRRGARCSSCRPNSLSCSAARSRVYATGPRSCASAVRARCSASSGSGVEPPLSTWTRCLLRSTRPQMTTTPRFAPRSARALGWWVCNARSPWPSRSPCATASVVTACPSGSAQPACSRFRTCSPAWEAMRSGRMCALSRARCRGHNSARAPSQRAAVPPQTRLVPQLMCSCACGSRASSSHSCRSRQKHAPMSRRLSTCMPPSCSWSRFHRPQATTTGLSGVLCACWTARSLLRAR
mmetsp:Transcript_21839/g.56175  ORF Transcript_21839/g.56175 Transcript_21839/m.56175 type:complete len:289 (-) Transcript_21839:1280-2146(-)